MFSYGIGFSSYHGDMHDIFYDGIQHALGPNLAVGLRKKFGSQLSLRVDLNWYQIGGDDADSKERWILSNRLSGRPDVGAEDDRYIRNLNFRSRNLELSVIGVFNFIPVDGSYSRRPIINPYITAGIARTTNRPKTYLPGEVGNYTVNLWQIQTEESNPIGTNKAFTVIPIGIGIRLKANQYIDILIEGARRFMFTDYLDNVSTKYPSIQEIEQWNGGAGSETARIALQIYDRSVEGGYSARSKGDTRGNPEANDAYYIFSLRLEMYLPDNFLGELFSPSRRKPKFR